MPLVKIVASALTLGTGGSGGREGPIAQIGAGFGSLLANLLHLKVADRRVLMAAGMGAGIAAIFRAPLAGALFAAEVLYRSPEFEAEVIMPAAIASVVSYCTFGTGAAGTAVCDARSHVQQSLGAWALSSCWFFSWSFWPCCIRERFTVAFTASTACRCRPHFRPAVGAFLTGLVALVLYYLVGGQQQVLAVLSFGYSAIQGAVTQDARAVVGAAGNCAGKDSDDRPDDRQRRLGRRVRPLDGHRRLWRRGLGRAAA